MTAKIKFNNETIKAVQEAPDFHEFCLKFACEACPFMGMEDCENTFDAFKKELEK